MTSGLTSTGMVIDTTDEILTKIESDETSTIDAALDTSPTQPLGQINGIFASQIENALQALQAAAGALDPANAEGQQLDVIAALTGTTREAASSTRVIATCSLDKGHVFTAATLDANGNVSVVGQLQAQIAGHPEFIFTAIGLQVVGGGIVLENIDTTAAVATQNYSVVFECTQTGNIACNAGTLTVISPAVAGWNSVTNPADAYSLGAAVETDTALRVRRQNELVPAGGGTFDSMLETLLKVAGTGAGNQGIIDATVLSNDGDTTDGNGVLPHAFACIIWDGVAPQAANNDIAQAIWNAKPAGVRAYDMGSGTSGTAVDGTGKSHTVGFSRATQDVLYIAIGVKIDSTRFPSDGDAQIAAALVAFGNTLGVGGEVDLNELASVCLEKNGGIGGVRTFSSIKCDTNAVPVGTADIVTAANHIPRFDTARVTVTHV